MPKYSTDFPLTTLTSASTQAGAEIGALTVALKYQISDNLAQPSKSTVKFDGTNYIVIDGPTGLVTHKGTDADVAIAAGMSNLTVSRVAKEKITLVGLFPTTESIVCEDYTILDIISARIPPILGTYSTDTADQAIIRNEKRLTGSTSDRNIYIDVIGGYIDGAGTFDTGKAISNIDFKFVEHLTITHVHSFRAREHGIAVDDCINFNIGYNQCQQSGDDGITVHDGTGKGLIIGNECYDGVLETSPSGGAENGIELENETSGPTTAPTNIVVAFNKCYNNDRGIVSKTASGEADAISHISFIGNMCYGNLEAEGIKVSSAGSADNIGIELIGNITFENASDGIRLVECLGATVTGGNSHNNTGNGLYLDNCRDTIISGGAKFIENGDHGVRGAATTDGTTLGASYFRDNSTISGFSYAISLDGEDTYIGSEVVITDTRGTTRQLGISVATTSLRTMIDGPRIVGWKNASGSKEGPIYLKNSTVPAGLVIREVRTPGNTDFVTENSDKATGIVTTGIIAHGLDFENGAVTDIDNSVSDLQIIVQGGTSVSPVITTTIDDTNITLTFAEGGNVDVFWKIAAHKWSA